MIASLIECIFLRLVWDILKDELSMYKDEEDLIKDCCIDIPSYELIDTFLYES
jgi:hypothetical protein